MTEGGDIATISTSGLLTATGNGYVTVRAYAVDGSGVYGEAQVQVKGLVSVEQIKQKGNRPELKVSYADNRFTILGIPADERATLYVYNTSGCLLKVDNVTGATAAIEGGGLPSGILLCRVVTDKWAETVRFIKP